jgi:hypothetical protein
MKLMYFLMDRDEQREKRLELEFEVGRSVRPSGCCRPIERARHAWMVDAVARLAMEVYLTD